MRSGMRGRSGATAAVALALAIAGTLLASPTASAAAAYRYWTYWQAPAGSWAFATAGPATTVPADGAVEGWRFAITSAAGRSSDQPRVAADFATICADSPAQADRKRVGLVIDFGTTDAAPEGQAPPSTITACVIAEPDATGVALLRSIAAVRTDDVGLICGLADYPRTGCADLVDDAAAPSSPDAAPSGAASPASATVATPTTDDGSPLPTLIAVLVIAALGGLAVLVSRRRRG